MRLTWERLPKEYAYGVRATLPWAWTVELASTSTGLPPDYPTGLSLNDCATFCRLVRLGWDSGWHQTQHGGFQRSKEWWELVESETDIADAWVGCCGGVWPPPRYDAVFFEGVAALDRS